MKVVIQSTRTLHFLRDDCSWATCAAEASAFSSSIKALDFCVRHKLTDVQIVLHFENASPDVILPVEEDWANLKQG